MATLKHINSKNTDYGAAEQYLLFEMCIRDSHMAVHEPFNVIYQTAEDGLGDTIKPRLMEAEADLDRILVIDESKQGPVSYTHLDVYKRQFLNRQRKESRSTGASKTNTLSPSPR